MNKHGIFINDIYILSYYGIKVIFQVCETYPESVRLIELEQKKYKDGWTLTKRLKPARYPMVVKGKNRFTKSTYEVKSRPDKRLEIKIDMRTELFWYALNSSATIFDNVPRVGTLLAVPFPEFRNKYWKNSKILKKTIDKKIYIN
jgi:hypothetical protein